MKRFLFVIPLGLIAIVLFLNQRGTIVRLHKENERLAEKTSGLPALRAEWEHLRAIEIDTNVLANLRGELPELMSLRAEVTRLRPVAQQSQDQLEREVAQRKTEMEAVRNRVKMEAMGVIRRRNLMLRRQIAYTLAESLKQYVTDYGRLPSSLEPFRSNVVSGLNSDYASRMLNPSDLPDEYADLLGAGLEDFELLPVPLEWNSAGRPMLFIREKSPHRRMDGIWERLYIDPSRPDSIVQAHREDRDFTDWEEEYLTSSPGDSP